MWKSMVLPSSITLARKMSLPTHSHISHIAMCCQFQWGRMLLLIFVTSLPKALTSAMTLICLSASSTYLYPTNPVEFAWIHVQQNTGTELAKKAVKYPEQYFNNLIDGHVIVCHTLPNENCLTQCKIALTKEMVIHLIKWYHCILACPGQKWSRMTIQARYYHPDIWKHVDNVHVISVNVLKSPTKEWDCYLNATSPIHRTVDCKIRPVQW